MQTGCKHESTLFPLGRLLNVTSKETEQHANVKGKDKWEYTLSIEKWFLTLNKIMDPNERISFYKLRQKLYIFDLLPLSFQILNVT